MRRTSRKATAGARAVALAALVGSGAALALWGSSAPAGILIRAYDSSDRQVGSDAWSWTIAARPTTTTTTTTATTTAPTPAAGTTTVATTTGTTTGPGRPGDGMPPIAHPIVGTGGADALNGTPGPDVILGLGGDDTIRGWGGDDVVVGGAGDDALYGDAGEDVLDAGPGKDSAHGGAGNDRLALVDGAIDQVADGGPGLDRLYADSSEGGSTAPPNVYSTAIEGRYLVVARPIVFEENGRLWLMDANGGSVVRLLPKTKSRTGTTYGSPRWSPDGTQVAFTKSWKPSGSAATSDLMVVNWDGTDLKSVTTTPALCEQSPSWSPDGTRLAYYVEPCPGEERVAQKALDPAAPVTYVSGENDFEDTEWRADGAYIYAGTCTGGGGGVYRVDPWTASTVTTFENPPGEQRTPVSGNSCAPELSLSAGAPFRLLFQTYSPSSPLKKSDRQIRSKDDSAPASAWGTNLTFKKPPAYFWGIGPDWSSDGNHIVFWHAGIWKMKPDGTGKQFLRTGSSPDWR